MRMNYSLRTACLSMLLIITAMFGINRSAFAEANYVYHEATTNNPGCGPNYRSVLTPNSSQSLTVAWKVEYQFYTDNVRLYYTTDGSNPSGSFGVPSGTTQVITGSYNCTFGSPLVDVATATIPAQRPGTVVKYIVSAWHSGGGDEIFANGPGAPCGSCGTITNNSSLATVFSYTVANTDNVDVFSTGGTTFASYTTLSAAVTAINGGTHTGTITAYVLNGYTETAPAGGYSITATGTVSNPITLRKTLSGGSNPTFTASAALIVGNLNDAIFKIIGGDYITIDGFTMQENGANIINTPAASNNMTEWGVALLHASVTDGAQNNTIQNCTISLNRTYANTFGVYSNNRHSATSVTVTEDITNNTTGPNSGNKIYSNSISNVNMGIAFIGCSTAANQDAGNDVGGSSSGTGNIISNWGGAAALSSYVSNSGTSYCIFMNHQTGDNVSYNTLTSATISGTSVTLRGIFKDYTTTSPTGTFTSTISNNTVTITDNFTSGTLECIRSQGMTALSTATININNNTILNTSIGGASSSTTVVGVVNSSAPGVLNMNNNVVRGTTSTATTGGFTGVSNTGAVVTTINMNSNQIGNVSGNAITFSAATSGSVSPLICSGGATTCSTTIQNNDIRGIVYSAVSSSTNTYITATGTPLNMTVNSNTFTNLNVNTTGTTTFILLTYSATTGTGTKTVSNNSIVTAYNRGGASGSVLLVSDNGSSVTGTVSNCQNNNFSNITVAGTTTITGLNYTDGGTAPTRTVSGNTLNSWTAGTGTINAMNFTYWNGVSSLSSNTITNITGQGAITGITMGSTVNTATSVTVSSNTINNLTSTGTGGTVTGITCTNTSPIININGNTINTLSSTGASAVTGISIGGATNTSIFKNKIYDLQSNNASAGIVSGILVSSGTTITLHNNLIGDLRALLTSSTDAIRGINLTSTSSSSNLNVYYNTIYINATSSGANFGTSGIFHTTSTTSTTATLNLRNNIIVNTSTPNGTGLTVAYRRSSGAANALANYGSASNNNLFYAGIPSAIRLIYSDGTSSAQTIAAYKAGVFTAGTIAPRDAASISENPTWVSTTGSNSNFLHINTTTATGIESGAANISGITDDFDGNIRQGNGGYSGTGTAPDIGGDEFELILPNCTVAVGGTTSGTATICGGTSATVSASGYSTGSGSTYQWEYSNDNFASDIHDLTGQNNPATASTGNLSASTYFRLRVSCATGPSTDYSTPNIKITVNSAPAVTVSSTPTNATICGTGSVSLTASATTTSATRTVTVQNIQFIPAVMNVNVGDVIHFQWVDGVHTTTSSSVPSGAATWDANINSGTPTFDYTVTVAGVYNYYCVIHGAGSMSGTFTANNPTYTWSPATGLSATTGASVSASPTATTTYTVTATDAVGCSATTTKTVTVGAAISLSSVTATPSTVCSGGSSALNATATTSATGYTVSSITYAALTPSSPSILANGGVNNSPGNYTSSGSMDDGYWNNISLPFTFNYFGNSYSTIRVATNGNVQFGTAVVGGNPGSYSWTPNTIPTAGGNLDNFIGGPWMDLNATSSGLIQHFTTGVSPNQIFVVDWENVPVFNSSDVEFSQILIYQNGTIEVHLGGNGLNAPSTTKALGLENATGSAGAVAPGRNSGTWTTTANEAWRFSPASINYSWSPSTFLDNASISNPNATNVTATTTYTVTASDPLVSACNATGTVTLTVSPEVTYYADADGDTYGNMNVTQVSCTGAPSGYVADNTDCNDANSAIHPGATETCNLIDDDCDTQIDEGVQSTFYADADGDGYGNPSVTTLACTAPTGYVSDNTDCNDADMNIHPGATEVCNGFDDDCDGLTDDADPSVTGQQTWYADADGDGYGNASVTTLACTAPTGYVSDNTDCNDANMNIHPGATEVCNFADDDCDGLVDEGITYLTYYNDADGDGYGAGVGSSYCTDPGPGFSLTNDDCNDFAYGIHPGATEVCNFADDDCDGLVDEGITYLTYYNDADQDGYGAGVGSSYCTDPGPGFSLTNDDCNDFAFGIHPGATELCNGIDDNCDGTTDEGCTEFTYFADTDNDGYGDPNNDTTTVSNTPPPGYVTNNTDCNDANSAVNPGATEVCNSIDDDCDTQIDEGVQSTFYADADGDGYGNPSVTTLACTAPTGYVSDNTDCNDANMNVNPGAQEICNGGIDDDCDGLADDADPSAIGQVTFYADGDGDGYGNPSVTTLACTAPSGYVSDNTDCNDANMNVHPGATEVCNGTDDDCDGLTDEGLTFSLYYVDADNDTYGSSTDPGTLYCANPGAGYSSNNTDCNDANSAVNPGANEICNGIDDNCDGNTDDIASPTVTISANCTAMYPGGTVILTASASAGSGTITTYQWVLNGTTNVGTNSATYTTAANAAGSYTVIVTNSNSCSTTSSAIVLTNVATGPLAGGTYTIPSTCAFPTISSAVNYINSNGLSGSVVFNVTAGHVETAPSGGVVLNQCALSSGLRSSASRTIVFQKSGGGNNPKINAYNGTGTTDGIVKIVGADYVTFNGIDVAEVIANTTTTLQMEWGYAILKCDGNEGANNNTIINCAVTLVKTNTASVGIYSGNHGPTSTTGFTYSGGTGNEDISRNGRNVLYGNTIANVYTGISLNGNASSNGSVSLNDTLNQIGVIGQTANSITNFGGSSLAVNAITETNERGLKVNNNSINGGSGSTGIVNGIGMGSGVWGEIRNNTITLASSATTSAMTGITCGFSGGSTANPNLVKITGNTIQNVNWTTPTTGTFTGITFAGGGTGSIDSISNNNVINNTTTAAVSGTSAFVGIASLSSAASITMSGNTVSGNTLNFTTTAAARQFNSIISTGAPTLLNIIGNTVNNNTNNGVGQITGIFQSTGGFPATANFNNNTVSNNTVVGGGVASSVFGIIPYGATYTANNNTVINSRVTTMTGAIAGTVIGVNAGTSSTPTSATITNNTLRKFFVGGTSTGAHTLRGISDNTGSTSGTKTVSGNQIDSLYTSSTAANPALIGILMTTGGTELVYNNRVYNLISNGSGTTGTVTGMQCVAGNSVGFINNYIGDLKAPASTNGTNAIMGFFLNSATSGSGVGLYFNTIRLSGGGGATFAASGVYVTSTTPVFDMRNNIIDNLCTPGSTSGLVVAYRRTSTGFTNYASTSNNNLFYAGTPGASNLIFYDGTNSSQTLAAYKTLIGSPRDQVSQTENVAFASTTPGASNYLHIDASVPTLVEGGATPISGITVDYDGDTRNTVSPDIGADEGNFINAAPVITSLTANPSTGQCSAVPHDVTATITPGPNALTSVTLNYAYNGISQAPIAMTNPSGNTWTGTIPAASPVNATVTWSVTATDGTYSPTATGTSYQDAYLTGVTATASASPSAVCAGSSTQLSVNAPGTVTIGTGILTNSTTTYPSPYGQYYGSTQEQYLIRASELSAAGLVQGNLTGLAFNLASGYTYAALQNFQVQIAGTSQSALTTTLITTGFTSVFGPATYTPPNAAGYATITFTTPFFWDGTSNIVVDVWFSNCSVCNGTSSCTTSFTNNGVVYQTATSYNSTVDYHADGNCTVNSFAPSFAGTLYTQRPNMRFNGVTTPTGFTSITWSDGVNNVGSGASVSVTPTGNTNYTATLTDANGCSITSSSASVTLLAVPAAPTATNSTQCGVGVPTASVSGSGGTFRWYLVSSGGTPLPGETGSQLTSYSISSTTTFYVSEFNGTCESPRVSVTANVITPDPVSAAVSPTNVCPNNSVTLTATQTGSSNTYVFTWTASPSSGSGISGSVTGQSVSVTPTLAGTYTYSVTAFDGTSNCTTTATTGTLTVTPPPVIVSATASPSGPVCAGSNVTLTALTNQVGAGNVTVGTGTLQNTTTTYPTPYGQWYGSTHEQYLILASELTAAGMYAGNITNIAWNLVTGYTYAPLQNFQVNMAHTAVTTLTTSLITTGFTNVIPMGTYTPPNTAGYATISFATPFNWNGTSNIVVDVSFSNCSVCNGTSSCTTSFTNNGVVYQTSTSYNSTVDFHADGNCTVNSMAPSFAGTTYLQRPNMKFGAQTVTTGPGALTWQWNPGAVNGNVATVAPTTSTTFTVTATDPATTCQSTATVSVTTMALPATPTATNSTQCGTAVPTASVSGSGGTFKWYLVSSGGTAIPGETGSQLTSYTVSSTTTFYVSEYDGSCESPRVAVTANVILPDAVSASVSSPTCLGSSIDLTATQTGSGNTYTFTWTASPSSGSGISGSMPGQSVSVTPTSAGVYIYTVTAYDASSNCTAVSSDTVTVTAPPAITSATASPNPSCSGSDVTLTALTGSTSQYMATVGTGTIQNTTTSYPAPYGNYYWGDREQMLIRASELTAAGLTAGNIYSLALNVVSNSGNSNYTNFEIGVKMTTATAVTLTMDASGFTTVVTGPYTVTIGWNTHTFSTPFYWDGTSNLLINTCSYVNTGFIYNAIFNQSATSYASTVDYHQDGSNAACSTVTGQLTYNQRPNMRIVGTQSTSGAGPYVWQWNPGALNGNVVTVSPTSNTTYTVTASDPASQCSSTQTVDVTVVPLPATPTATPSTQCGYGVPTASVSGAGGSFRWYLVSSGGTALAGETGNQLSSYAISSTTTFYVSEFNGTCESPRVAVLANVTQPDAVTAAHSSPTCSGSSITLTATQTGSTNNYVYTWTASPSAGSGISGSVSGQSVNITPTASGTYIYTVTAYDAGAGCTYVTSTTVTMTASPAINNVTASPSNVCSGGITTLSAQSGTGGPGTATVGTGATNTQAGSPFRAGGGAAMRTQFLFTASELTAAGLSAGNLTSVSYNFTTGSGGTLPNYTISIGNTSVTALTSTFETTPLTSVYGPSSVNPPTGTGPFGLTFTTPFYWNGTSNIIVQVCHDNPSPTAGSGNVAATTTSFVSVNQLILANACGTLGGGLTQSIRPDATFGGQVGVNNTSSFTWVWNPGNLSGSTVNASPPNGTTTYTVTATDPVSGCTSSATTTVTAGTPLVVSVNSTTVCAGQSSTLTATVSGGGFPYTYSWSPGGATTASITVSPSSTTTYTVSVGDNCGNLTTANGTVNVNPLPVVTVTPNNPTICPNSSGVALTASGANTYTWSPTTNLSPTTGPNVTANPTTNTTYVVTGTDGNGCTNTASSTVTVSPVISVSATATPTDICAGGSSQLQATATQPNSSGVAGYSFLPISGTFTPIVGGTTVTLASGSLDDGLFSIVPLSFAFNYAGVAYTQVVPSTNGTLFFGTSGNTTTVNSLTSNTPRPFIAPLSDDMDAISATVSYLVTGGPGNHVFTFEWLNCEWYYNVTGGATISLQAKLYEATGQIEFVYRQESGPLGGVSEGASIGLAGVASGNFLSLNNSSSSPTASSVTETTTINTKPATGQIYRFTPPVTTGITYLWQPDEFLSDSTIANPVASGLTTSQVFTVTVTSPAGCTASGSVAVNVVSTDPTFSGLDPDYCADAGAVLLVPVQPGGVFSGPGVIPFGPDYYFDPSTSGIGGPFTIIYTTMCASDSQTTTVHPLPVVTLNPFPPVCSDAAPVLLTGGSPAGGIYFDGDGYVDGTYFYPGAAGVGPHTIFYAYTDPYGCASLDQKDITVEPAATVHAGPDQTICPVSDASLNGSFGGSATSVTWSTSGDGTFADASDPGTTYSPGTADQLSGSVTLTLTTDNPAGACGAVSDDVVITLSLVVTYYPDVDGDGYGAGVPLTTCVQPTGYVSNNLDCNDNDASIHPDQTDMCNTIDDDCDGLTDEDATFTTWYADADGDFYGDAAVSQSTCDGAPSGYVANNADCNDADANVNPGMTEICANGIDDNCDGQVDEGCAVYTYYVDVDGDTYGDPDSSISSNSNVPPPGYVADNTDCNDNNPAINPGVTDVCNGIDDNCNGLVDENPLVATVTPSGTVSYCQFEPVTLSANVQEGMTYQWYKNNVIRPGATNSTFTTTKKGNFKVVESNGFCTATSPTTTINRLQVLKAAITVYGNPDICTTGSVLLRANKAPNSPHAYQWSKSGLPISGATDRDYIATTTGDYTVTVTNYNGCATTSPTATVTSSCKGSQPAIFSAELNLYPNPNHGDFVVELHFSDDLNAQADVQVLNTLGQTVYLNRTAVVNGELFDKVKFDYGISAGNYLVRVIVGDKVYTGQIIYQK